MHAVDAATDDLAVVDLGPDAMIRSILRLLRTHLDLDVAFVSHLTDGLRIVRHLDAHPTAPVIVGTTDRDRDSLCAHVVAGRLPQLLRDPAAHPVTAPMDVVRRLRVGTHLAVPIVLGDGEVYGTLTAFAHRVRPGIDERDLATVQVLAGVVADRVGEAEAQRRRHQRRRSELASLTPGRDVHLHYQPIVDLTGDRTVAIEALARFPGLPGGPALVFDEAWDLGVGLDLELGIVEAALAVVPQLPDGVALTVNVAPATLTSPVLDELLDGHAAERLVFEVTEHAAVDDYPRLATAVGRLRGHGARLAVDDVGTGFSGLDHILRLGPEVLKIDGELIRDVDRSASKQAMVAALESYASRTGTELVAERIETADELATLVELGVGWGQGFHLARPGELADVLPVSAR